MNFMDLGSEICLQLLLFVIAHFQYLSLPQSSSFPELNCFESADNPLTY